MCGIAGVYLKDPSIINSENDRKQFDRFVDQLLLGIEARGTDATGFVSLSGSSIRLRKDAVTAHQFIKTRPTAWLDENTRAVLLHTRFATQGHQSRWENNHPVLYAQAEPSRTVLVTHNGHIRNDDSIFNKYKLDRHAEVDTIAIAAAIAQHGLENAPEALKQLRGGFAFAAIEPIAHPDTVLLAKGPSYPLVWYEGKNIIVWASTSISIREAWAEVLGTAPTFDNFKILGEGDGVLISPDGAEYKKDYFETEKYTYCDTSFGTGYTGTKYRKRRSVTKLNMKGRAADLRSRGDGVALIWDKKDEITEEQKKRHNYKWAICMHCLTQIADMDIIDSIKWGEICRDCLKLAWDEKAEHSAITGAIYLDLSEDELETLENFATMDDEIVRNAIEATANEIGISTTLVEYMLFRSGVDNTTEAYKEAVEAVQLVYNDFEELEWEALASSKEELAPTDPFVSCGGNIHRESETCDHCAIVTPPNHQITKCLVCSKKAKVYLGTNNAWCNKHFHKCSESGCNEKPVAFTSIGRRVCHIHSRGVKALRYDSTWVGSKKEEIHAAH